jgi:hypothetical protein
LPRRTLAAYHPSLLLSLVACSDPTGSVPTRERATTVAAVVTSTTPTVVSIGDILGYGVSDAGTIVGPSGGNRPSAYLWDGSSLRLLGSGGLAWDVAGDGYTVGGKNAADAPVVWTATPPSGAFRGHGHHQVHQLVLEVAVPPVGQVRHQPQRERMTNGITNKTPAKWTCAGRDVQNGWRLTTLTLTPPIASLGSDINPSGMIVGMEDGCCWHVLGCNGAQSC